MFAISSTMQENNLTIVCMNGGNTLAAVKMPGGNLPWEIDIDVGYAFEVSEFSKITVYDLLYI